MKGRITSLDSSVVLGDVGEPGIVTRAGRTGAVGIYNYGSSSDSGVVAHWKMDESSSPIVDEVASLSLATEYGPMTYRVAGTGDWANFTGITFPGTPTYGDFYIGNGTTCSLGTERAFVLELVMSCSEGNGDYLCPFSCETSGTSFGWYLDITSDLRQWIVQMTVADTSYVRAGDYWNAGGIALTAGIHKFRLVGLSTGYIKMYLDGQSAFPNKPSGADFTSLNGKEANGVRTVMGAVAGSGHPFRGTIYECRLTKGNSTNNSGGPGGG